MRRVWAVTAVLLVVAGMLAGCGDSPQHNSEVPNILPVSGTTPLATVTPGTPPNMTVAPSTPTAVPPTKAAAAPTKPPVVAPPGNNGNKNGNGNKEKDKSKKDENKGKNGD